jgi:hypothetical protein
VKRLPSWTRHFTPVGLLIAKTETFSGRSAIAARFVLFGVSAYWLSLSTRRLSQIRLYFDNKIVRAYLYHPVKHFDKNEPAHHNDAKSHAF